LYDALITWDLIGYIDVTPVSLKFWKQFDQRVSARCYEKGSQGYKVLSEYVRDWANKIVLQLEKATPSDYVLVECIEKETGEPYGPRGMIRSLSAALGVIDAYNGLAPPNWGHPIPGSSASNELPVAQLEHQRQRVARTDSSRHAPDIYYLQQSNSWMVSATAGVVIEQHGGRMIGR
jgi:glucoamylase